MTSGEEKYRDALNRIRPAAEARAQREQREEDERREREEAIKEEHRRVSAELHPLISEWLNELSAKVNEDLGAIGELIVLGEHASYASDGFPNGATVYFVPHGTPPSEVIEKSYQFTKNWSEFARRRQVEFTRSTARLSVLVIRENRILVRSDVNKTEEEEEKYWLAESPRTKQQLLLYLPSGSFSYDTLKEFFFRFLTWILNDAPSLEPRPSIVKHWQGF